jgi:predicted ArsR family transcriptional regulator
LTPSRQKILDLLKWKGPQTAAELAERIDITVVAVRQHLQSLTQEGMLQFDEERQAVGRPVHRWRLTEAAQQKYPDQHSNLVSDLLLAVNDNFGPDGVERVVEGRSRQMLARYRKRMPNSSTSLTERIQALTALRDQDGYLAEFMAEDDGHWVITENHCPIREAAQSCKGFCAWEVMLFQELLGETVRVERTEHQMDGSRRCVYRIEKVTPSKP